MPTVTGRSSYQQNQIVPTGLPYTLIYTRNADGTAAVQLVNNATNAVVLTDTGYWDDATPWDAGRYLMRPQGNSSTQTFDPKYPWYFASNPLSNGSPRTEVTLHEGLATDYTWGCLAVSGTPAGTNEFLDQMKAIVGFNSVVVDVRNNHPLTLSLSASSTSLVEGEIAELTVSLNRPTTKDIWVKLANDDFAVLGYEEDIQLIDSNLVTLNNYLGSGQYVRIREGTTSAKVAIKALTDTRQEGTEQFKIEIDSYQISNDRDNRFDPDNNSSWYADPGQSLINANASSLTISVSDQPACGTPINRSGSSGTYPFDFIVSTGHTVSYSFQAYTITDRLIIRDGQQVLLDTGFVSGLHQATIAVPSSTVGTWRITVEGNQDTGTAWDLSVICNEPGAAAQASFWPLEVEVRSEAEALASLGSDTTTLSTPIADSPTSILLIDPAAPSASVTGAVASPGATVRHSETLTAGRTYLAVVIATDSDLDPALALRSSGGVLIEQFTDMINNEGTFAFFQASGNETVHLDVSGEDGTTGRFTLETRDVTGQSQSIYSAQINSATLIEGTGDSSDNAARISISRDGDLSASGTVSWQLIPRAGTGASLADLTGVTALTGQVSFAPGEAIKLLDIGALADNLSEPAESFEFRLTTSTGGIVSPIISTGFGSTIGFTVIDTPFLPMTKSGTDGPDQIIGGPLADSLAGGFGDDMIVGGDGPDQISGQGGNDTADGQGGSDTLTGGDGDDLLLGDGALGFGSGAFAKTAATGNNSRPQAVDLSGLFSLASDPDIANSTTLPHVSVTATANGAVDYYKIVTSTAGVRIVLDIDHAAFDSYIRIQNASGVELAANDDSGGDPGSASNLDSFLDYTTTSAGTFYIEVGAYPAAAIIPNGATYELQVSVDAAAVQTAVAGDDRLTGGPGADVVKGGDGNDIVYATHDDGNDTYTGGNGFDILDFSQVNGVVQINQLAGTVTGSAGNDTLSDVFEQIKGTNFNDVLSGGHGINVLDGEGGNDQLFANNGDDLVRGGAGDDTFFFSTNDGNDSLLGGDGFDVLDYSSLGGVVQVNQLAGTTTGTANNDILQDVFEMVIGTAFGDVLSGGHGPNSLKGNGGADQIFANNGDDYMSGGTGNDTLTGGIGSDRLDFRNGDGVDTWLDFVAGGTDDSVVLTFYSGLGITSFAQLQSSGRLSTVSGHAELALNGGDRIIFSNVASHTLLTAADFVFL